MARIRLKILYFLLPCPVLVGPPASQSRSSIPVRCTAGPVHGFLVLRTLEGETLAHGDLIQIAHGNL